MAGRLRRVALLGVLVGILVAILLSLGDFVRRAWRPHDAVLGREDELKGYHDLERHPNARQIPGLLLYRFDAPLFFANADYFRRRISDLVATTTTPIRWVVVAAEPITDVDTTAADTLLDLLDELRQQEVVLAFAEMKGPVKDRLRRYGLYAQVGSERSFRPSAPRWTATFGRRAWSGWTGRSGPTTARVDRFRIRGRPDRLTDQRPANGPLWRGPSTLGTEWVLGYGARASTKEAPMKVSDLQHHELFTAQADESLDEAADRMNWHQVGALPVLEGQRLVGIISERDLTAALAEGADPVLTPVSDYMTPAPEVLQPDNELADAAHLMLELGIRHLPIVRSGRLVGVLSMRDVLDADTYGGDGTGSTTGRVR